MVNLISKIFGSKLLIKWPQITKNAENIYIKMFRIVFEEKHSSSTIIYLALSNTIYVILCIGYIQYTLSLVISTFCYISKFKLYYKIKIREAYNYQSTRIRNGITQKSSLLAITQEISVVASERPRPM